MILILLRAFLLWVVVPLGFLFWLPLAFVLRRRGVGLGQYLGWLDGNLVVLLQRSVLRPFYPEPAPWFTVSVMSDVTHRIGWTDPA